MNKLPKNLLDQKYSDKCSNDEETCDICIQFKTVSRGVTVCSKAIELVNPGGTCKDFIYFDTAKEQLVPPPTTEKRYNH